MCGNCNHRGSEAITTCKELLQKAYDNINQHEESLYDSGNFPCEVGTTVYSFYLDKIIPLRVESFITYRNYTDARLASDAEEYRFLKIDLDVRKFGKEWFLTESEAEAARKRMEQEV